MPNIIVCYKWVMDEQDIYINAETLALETSRAKYKISDYDRNAIEEGMRIIEKHGGSLKTLTYGLPQVKSSLKGALSRGPEAGFWIGDESAAHADAYVTANVLAAAIRKIGEYDIIICGEGSSDVYSQQVGPRLAALLGITPVSFVESFEILDDKMIARRNLGHCIEVIEVQGPLMMSVLPDINSPRLATVKQLMAAGKKPTTEFKIAELDLAIEKLQPKNKVEKIKGAVFDRKNIMLREETMIANVTRLVEYMDKEGVLL